MTKIEKHYYINASAEKTWKALTEKQEIEKWGGGPAEMDENIGTNFYLWGGDIHGTNIEIIQNVKLVQDWFGGNWEKPSRVVFTLKPTGTKTQLSLLHTEVPENEVSNFDSGWDDYYLGAIKKYLES